jgi:CRISPR-associated protein Csx17
MPELRLDGCTPEPLMAYLKALGVLRLVSEQADTEARGAWRDGVFVLGTKFDRDGLAKFFLAQYSPTPLLAPWNGGSGFYIKLDLERFLDSDGKAVGFKDRKAVDAINAIEGSDSERLARYRAQIRQTKRALVTLAEKVDFRKALAEPLRQWPQAKTKLAKKKVKDEATKKVLNTMLLFRSGDSTFSVGKAAKDEFVSHLRSKVLTDDGLSWLDSALAMRTGQKKNRVEAPTLGSGGNIGNSDFSARFAQLLAKVLPLRTSEPIPAASTRLLEAALFGAPAPSLQAISVDQFDPGKAGGANGTQGMDAVPMLNPWDYVLMMEGALALGGNTSRRLGVGRASASFPFVVESSPAGHGSVGNDTTRGEAWMPLWSAPALFGEVKLLLSEGRAELGPVRARSGVTFAQAVAGLGVDRGIDAFVRYEFQERLGQSYIATPVGRFNVPQSPLAGVELVRALNQWLDSFRYACRTKKQGATTDPPSRFPASLRRIESGIFDFCKYGGADHLAHVIAGLGAAERELSIGDMPPDKRRVRRPLADLSSAWINACDDGSAEFRLALSLAFLRGDPKTTGPIRRYLEPVKWDRKGWSWTERGGHVVWSGGDVARNLGAVLTRRLLDAEKAGETPLPLGSRFPASLADVAEFLAGRTDDEKLADLLWGLMLIDSGKVPKDFRRPQRPPSRPDALPSAYALLKLTLLPFRVKWSPGNAEVVLRRPEPGEDDSGILVKPEPAILGNLQAGIVQAACEIAARRLRSSGLTPLASYRADGSRRAIAWSGGGASPPRLLAALLFPITAVNFLAELVLRRPPAESLA